MKNKIKSLLNNIEKTTWFIISIMIIETIYLMLSKVAYGNELNGLLDLSSPIIFGLIMLGYSHYHNKMYIGIIDLSASMILTLTIYMVYGYDFKTAIAMSGLELPISIMGVSIMIVVQAFKQYKVNKEAKNENKESNKVTLAELFGAPKKVKIYYKIIVFSLMYSIFLTVYINNDITANITNTTLKTLFTLQSLMPIFIMLAYITFTDLALWTMVIYNIVYVISSILSLEYIGIDYIIIANTIEFTVIVALNILKSRKLVSKEVN